LLEKVTFSKLSQSGSAIDHLFMVFSAENIPNRSTYVRGPLVASNSSSCARLSKKSFGSFTLLPPVLTKQIWRPSPASARYFKFDKSNTEQPAQYLNGLPFLNEKKLSNKASCNALPKQADHNATWAP
jgi:hypothetical protein